MRYTHTGATYLNFTVGQTVITRDSIRNDVPAIIEVLDTGDDTAYIKYIGIADNDWIKIDKLIPVPLSKEEEKKVNSADFVKSWKLHLQSTAAIDWELIIQDMTPKHPVLLITTNEGNTNKEIRYVAYHKSLVTKARVCGGALTSSTRVKECIILPNAHIFRIPTMNNTFTPWVKRAHLIQSMPWPKRLQNHPEISVVTPF